MSHVCTIFISDDRGTQSSNHQIKTRQWCNVKMCNLIFHVYFPVATVFTVPSDINVAVATVRSRPLQNSHYMTCNLRLITMCPSLFNVPSSRVSTVQYICLTMKINVYIVVNHVVCVGAWKLMTKVIIIFRYFKKQDYCRSIEFGSSPWYFAEN
jgi:hypothetical protein